MNWTSFVMVIIELQLCFCVVSFSLSLIHWSPDCGRAPGPDPQTALPSSCSKHQGGDAQDQEEAPGTALALQVPLPAGPQAGPVRPALCGGAQQAAGEAAHKVTDGSAEQRYSQGLVLVPRSRNARGYGPPKGWFWSHIHVGPEWDLCVYIFNSLSAKNIFFRFCSHALSANFF